MLLSRVGYEGANDYKFKFGISNITEIGYADFMRGVGACGVCQPGATSLGHEPRIIPAVYVKPFVKGQKNDYNDAEAIAEAALRPNLRFAVEKSQDQLDLQACHRVRSRLVSRRTATINQIRAFLINPEILSNRGVAAAQVACDRPAAAPEPEPAAVSDAFLKLQKRAQKLQKREPNLSEAVAFARVYADPANRDLFDADKAAHFGKSAGSGAKRVMGAGPIKGELAPGVRL